MCSSDLQIVLLNIDEVIAIIRESDEPKAALIARFALTPAQADDILDIRLRQLARLEAIRIEQELAQLRQQQAALQEILDSPAALRRLMVSEIEADAQEFGDARRTLIHAEKKAMAEVKVADEPVTVIISAQGWARARQGGLCSARRWTRVRGMSSTHRRWMFGNSSIWISMTACLWRARTSPPTPPVCSCWIGLHWEGRTNDFCGSIPEPGRAKN